MSSDERHGIRPLLAPMFLHPSEDPDTGEGYLRPYPPVVLVLREIRPPFWWYDYTDTPVNRETLSLGARHASRVVTIDGSYQGSTEYALLVHDAGGYLTVSPGI